MSVNAVSGIGALFGIGAMATGGVSLTLLMLTALHIIDLVCGIDESREGDLDNMQSAGESVGPLTHFFTTSWKSNSFNKRNFVTCQTTQVIFLCLELYFALILTVEGGLPKSVEALLLLTVIASLYSFFSPKRLTAVDAMQSNGVQIGILGVASSSILAYSPGAAFYSLFAIMALDLFMSVSTFVHEHG